MKIVLKIAGAFSLFALTATAGVAQSTTTGNSATSTTTASTTIATPLTISNTAVLAFGKVYKPSSAGTATVTLSPLNVSSVTSASGAAFATGGTTTAAAFTANGEGTQAFTISAPNFSMAGPTGATALVVTPILSTASAINSLAAGALQFTVGGSFPLTSAAVTGAYSGPLVVTVTYN